MIKLITWSGECWPSVKRNNLISQFRMLLSCILNWRKKLQAASVKQQAVDNLKKEFDICRTVLYKVIIAFIANAAQDGRQLKLDEARRLVHKTCVARRTART